MDVGILNKDANGNIDESSNKNTNANVNSNANINILTTSRIVHLILQILSIIIFLIVILCDYIKIQYIYCTSKK